MIGISIASRLEWKATCDYFDKRHDECISYPLGMYFITQIKNEDLIFYYSGSGKAQSSAACQYMIDHHGIHKLIVVGTCAGIDDKYNILDIIMPNMAVQCDCTVKELEPLIKERFRVDIDLSKYEFKYHTGTIGTSDKPVVTIQDYSDLKKNDITVADMEAAAIAYICKCNNIDMVIIKGISDFPISHDNLKKAYDQQIQIYEKNTEIIIREIFSRYLENLF